MRKTFFQTLIVSLPVIAAATTVVAADLPSRRVPPVYAPPPTPVFTWTGFFVGGNAGAAFDQKRGGGSDTYYLPAGSVAGSTGTAGTLTTGGNGGNNDVAFAGGAQIGYNYQLTGGLLNSFGGGVFGPSSGVVVGFVADAQYLDTHRGNGDGGYSFSGAPGNAFVAVPGLPATTVSTTNAGIPRFFGTARGRLGVNFDRVLVYGTGGFAYNTKATGYTFGGGLEYAIANNVTIGGEYLYVNLNHSTTSDASGAVYTPGTLTTGGTLTGEHQRWAQQLQRGACHLELQIRYIVTRCADCRPLLVSLFRTQFMIRALNDGITSATLTAVAAEERPVLESACSTPSQAH